MSDDPGSNQPVSQVSQGQPTAAGRRDDAGSPPRNAWPRSRRKREAGAIVSIPSNALVDVPGHGLTQLWNALPPGGPSLLLRAVEHLTNGRRFGSAPVARTCSFGGQSAVSLNRHISRKRWQAIRNDAVAAFARRYPSTVTPIAPH